MNTSKQVNVMIGLLFIILIGTLLYYIWEQGLSAAGVEVSDRPSGAQERQIVKNAERGGGLFSLNCRSCHGITGRGAQENPNLPGFPLNNEFYRPDDPGELLMRQNRVRDTIRCGRVGTLMPQWAEEQGGPLNDFQIEQLVALITGAMPGLDAPSNLDAVSELGWEAAIEEADHADILEGKKLALDAGPEDTVLVLTDAQGLNVGSLLRIDDEVVLVRDAPARSSLAEEITEDQTDLPVDRAGHLFRSGDRVQVDSEQMRVISASGNILSVERARDGTEAKDHRVKAAVFEPSKEIAVDRGAFGTQAAAHDEGTQIFAGPLEPPTGPLTGENGDAPCGQRGVAAPAPTGQPTPTPTGEPSLAPQETPTDGGATAEIKMVPVIQFDRTELTIAADTEVTVISDNTEVAVPHNFAVYRSEDDANSGGTALAATIICSGPCIDTTIVNLSAGEYFFRCDVHPVQMTGQLLVTE